MSLIIRNTNQVNMADEIEAFLIYVCEKTEKHRFFTFLDPYDLQRVRTRGLDLSYRVKTIFSLLRIYVHIFLGG